VPSTHASELNDVVVGMSRKGTFVRADDCATDSGLRFDNAVPQKTIRLPVLETLRTDRSDL